MKKKIRKSKLLITAAALAAAVLAAFFLLRTHSEGTVRMIFIPKIIDSTNDFWTSVIAGANMGAKEYGVQLTIKAGPDEEDWQSQNALIKKAIEEKPDALLVAPCSYTESTDLIEEAVKTGIKVTLIDSLVDRLVQNLTVATDNVAAGKQLGAYAATLISQDAKIAVIEHVKGASTAIDREKGVRQGLGDKASCIKEIVFSGSSVDRAYSLTKKLIQDYPDLAMVIGLNEPSAVGAAEAIKDLGLTGKVKTVGFDSSLKEVQLMEEGVFSGIVIQKPYNMGYLGIQETWKLLHAQSYTGNLESGSKLITTDNLYSEENQKLLFPFTGTGN